MCLPLMLRFCPAPDNSRSSVELADPPQPVPSALNATFQFCLCRIFLLRGKAHRPLHSLLRCEECTGVRNQVQPTGAGAGAPAAFIWLKVFKPVVTTFTKASALACAA